MNASTLKQVTRVAAYGLVCDNEHILLCRISDQFPHFAGYWTLPGGGVEWREHPELAMVREVKEETGLDVRAREIAGIDCNAVDIEQTAYHGIRIIYRTRLIGGVLTPELDGTTDRCEWLAFDQLNDLPLVDLAQAGVRLARSPTGAEST